MQKGVPIRPSDIAAAKAAKIPGFVIDVFNELIQKHFRNGKAFFYLKEAQEQVEAACFVLRIPFDSNMLNVEPAFEQHGWDVFYDSPGYGDDYPAKFTFTPKKPDDGPRDSK